MDEGAEKRTVRGHFLRFFRTLALLCRFRPDVVQINVPWQEKGISSIVACGVLRIPTQVVFHLAPAPFPTGRGFRKLGLWAKGRAQDWVAVSRHNRNMVAASYGIDPATIEVVYNGIRLPENKGSALEREALRSRVRAELGLSRNHRVLLTVGRLNRQKGYHELADVALQLCRRHPDVRFLWAGDGDLRDSLVDLLARGGVAQQVLMLGHRDDVPSLLRASDLFVFPSHFEGFPFALLEAMAYGVPVVASEACGISELVEPGVHGLLCGIGDRNGLFEALEWALEHPVAMRRMAGNALVRVQGFSEENMLNTTLARLANLGTQATNG
jgi:glycosyltransferase involved in cell wall biosynthesis